MSIACRRDAVEILAGLLILEGIIDAFRIDRLVDDHPVLPSQLDELVPKALNLVVMVADEPHVRVSSCRLLLALLPHPSAIDEYRAGAE